jgi:hypothetical protein
LKISLEPEDVLPYMADGCAPDQTIVQQQKRIAALEKALREIVLRTSAYRNDPDWPLVSGVHAVASDALK